MLKQAFNESLSLYLKDESKLIGNFEYLYKVNSQDELYHLLYELIQHNEDFLIQASKSSISATATPFCKNVIDTSELNKIYGLYEHDDNICLLVDCATSLSSVHNYLKQPITAYNFIDNKETILNKLANKQLTFTCDPSFADASIAGMISTNASGINAYKYGRMNKHIDYIEFVDCKGAIHKIYNSDKTIAQTFELDEKYLQALNLSPNSSLIDLICANEGKSIFILKAGIKLSFKQASHWSLLALSKDLNTLFDFCDELKNDSSYADILSCIDICDKNCINLINDNKSKLSLLNNLDEIDNGFAAFAYIELCSDDESLIETKLEDLLEKTLNYGEDNILVLAGSDEDERAKIKLYRTCICEIINIKLDELKTKDSCVVKCSSDFSYKDFNGAFLKAIDLALASNIDFCTFGHYLLGHLHLNFLVKNSKELTQSHDILKTLAQDAYELYSEHGIGKLKNYLYSEDDMHIKAFNYINNVLKNI